MFSFANALSKDSVSLLPRPGEQMLQALSKQQEGSGGSERGTIRLAPHGKSGDRRAVCWLSKSLASWAFLACSAPGCQLRDLSQRWSKCLGKEKNVLPACSMGKTCLWGDTNLKIEWFREQSTTLGHGGVGTCSRKTGPEGKVAPPVIAQMNLEALGRDTEKWPTGKPHLAVLACWGLWTSWQSPGLEQRPKIYPETASPVQRRSWI